MHYVTEGPRRYRSANMCACLPPSYKQSRVDSANIHLKAIQAGYSVMQHTNASQSGLLQIIFLCKGWMGVFAFGFTFLFLSLTQLVSIDIAYFTLIMIFHVA